MASSDPDERRLAREDPIEKYLLYYPGRDDDQGTPAKCSSGFDGCAGAAKIQIVRVRRQDYLA